MPRNISFQLTTDQIRNRTKTVTRRLGWSFLQPGQVLNACVKCQGLGKGGKIERICQVRVVDVQSEPLNRLYVIGYGQGEAKLEGFPGMSGDEFIRMFCEHMKCDPSTVVNRIEFEYLESAAVRGKGGEG